MLTANFIKIAVAEPGKERSVYWDVTMPGFGLVVTSSGARSFVYQYRANGKSRRFTLDGKLALADARKEARKRMGEVAKGSDPVEERRRQIATNKTATSGTLEFVAREYFRREGRRIRTMAEREATFERLVFPKLGAQPINEIRRVDLSRLFDQIEDQRGPVMANQTLAFLRRVFNWHAARSDDFSNPIVRGMRSVQAGARSRVLSDEELRALWSASGAPGSFSSLVKFILLTATRRNEAAHATWDEISGDVWTIPAQRYKTKVDMTVPLSKAAQAVLADIPRMSGGQFIFSCDGRRPISSFSRSKRALDRASGVTGWTIHDLRRTARSLMSRAGVPADIAERAVGHVIPGIRAVYDRHAYRDEKGHAFEKLAELVHQITRG
jgi:integrase